VSVFDSENLVYQFNPAKIDYSYKAALENYNKLQDLIARK
jgi:hypothetical protein